MIKVKILKIISGDPANYSGNKFIEYFKPGTTVDIETDKDNIPISKYWRNRMKDMKYDNCIEILDGISSYDKAKSLSSVLKKTNKKGEIK